MQVKFVLPFLVGAALLSACGDGTASGSSTTAVNLNSTSFATLAPTLSTVPPPTTVPTEGQISAAAQDYTIVAGDYLSGIATRFGVTAEAIALANSWADGIAHAIFPGDIIKIPEGALVPAPTTTVAAGTATTTANASTTTTVATDSNGCTPGEHTIVEGDLPGTVAKQYDVTLEQLAAANANTSGYQNFIVGVKIVIPCT